jgi:hypothetical protein
MTTDTFGKMSCAVVQTNKDFINIAGITGLLKVKLPAPTDVCQICADPTVMFTPKVCPLAELFVMLPLFVMPAALLIVKAPPPASKVIPLVTAVAPLMFVRF